MADSTTLTVRMNRSVKNRLDALAKSTKRSKSFLAAEAIEEFIAVQEWQIAGIEEALASLDRGEGVPHEEVKAWVASLATDDEVPPTPAE